MQMPTATDPTLLSRATNPSTAERPFGPRRTQDANVSPDQIKAKMPVARPAEKETVPFSIGDKNFMARFDPARLDQIAEFEFQFKFVQSTQSAGSEHRGGKIEDGDKHGSEVSFKASFEALIEKPVERLATVARSEIRDALKGRDDVPGEVRQDVLSVRKELKSEISVALDGAKHGGAFDAEALQTTLRSAFEGFISALGSIFGQNDVSAPNETSAPSLSSPGDTAAIPASQTTVVTAELSGTGAVNSAPAAAATPAATPLENAAQAERADAEAVVAQQAAGQPKIADLFAGFLNSVQSFFEKQFTLFAESLAAANEPKNAGRIEDDDQDNDNHDLASPVEASLEAKFEAEFSYSQRTDAGVAAYSASFSASYSFSASSSVIDVRS